MERMVPEQNIRQDEVKNKYNYHGKKDARAKYQTRWGEE